MATTNTNRFLINIVDLQNIAISADGTTSNSVFTQQVADLNAQLAKSSIPVGGEENQVLTKNSSNDYDIIWKTPEMPIVISGFYQVAFSAPSTFSTNSYNTSQFPARIGVWSIPTATKIVLKFNNAYYGRNSMPNFSGMVYWWNGTTYKVNPIPTIGVSSGSYPGINVDYSKSFTGLNWTMTYSITGTSYAGSINNGPYGFFLYLNLFN